MRFRTSILLALVCAAALALAGPASAENPTQSAYGPNTCSACSTTSSGSLPFTGIDVALVAVFGVSLTGVGLVIQRRLGARAD